MKIGIDARMYGDRFTGIGRYNVELTKCLFELGKDHQWVLFLNQPEFDEVIVPSHVNKICVHSKHYSLAEQTKFLRILRKEKCDLVHFTHFNLPLGYRKPFIVTIHDTTISFYPGKKMNSFLRKLAYQAVIRNAIRASKRIITVSENTKKDVVRLFHSDSQKIMPIHIGVGDEFVQVSNDKIQKIKDRFGMKGKFLLYTGNWREHKNLVGLLNAFSILLKQEKYKDLKLVITGKPDPHYPEVLETVISLGIKDSVLFPGLVSFEELITFFSGADVFVFPTFYEGFGLPPLEAMKCGTVVAASNVASVPEVCSDAALYFDPENSENMADVIGKLLDDDVLRESLIKKGFERVKRFNWDNCAEKTWEEYRSILGL